MNLGILQTNGLRNPVLDEHIRKIAAALERRSQRLLQQCGIEPSAHSVA
jgi:hypothetical protein